MWLPWYRLVDAPLHAHYELLGASIPAPAMALACALGAAVVALLRAAMGGWRLPARESVLLAVFGVVSLGLVLYARLVQPAQARFVISHATMDDAVWPRPWFGLLLGLAGAGAILIAALLARSHRAQPMESKPQTR